MWMASLRARYQKANLRKPQFIRTRPVVSLQFTSAKGKLTFQYSTGIAADEILRFHPEFRSMLEDIKRQGWKYLYIETRGRATGELDLEKAPCKFMWNARGYFLEIEIGPVGPTIIDVPEVEEFRINVSTRSFPRAATVDLSKGIVTYLHEAFWGWQKEREKDLRKLSECKEVYEVARWLIDVKKQRLSEGYDGERYKELCKLLE